MEAQEKGSDKMRRSRRKEKERLETILYVTSTYIKLLARVDLINYFKGDNASDFVEYVISNVPVSYELLESESNYYRNKFKLPEESVAALKCDLLDIWNQR